VNTKIDVLRRRLQDKERAMARRLARAQAERDTFWMVASGVALLFVLAPFWDGPRMPPELRAFALTMNVAAAACLGAWFVSNRVWLPLQLRQLRAALDRVGAE
jgi:hypothetical protein